MDTCSLFEEDEVYVYNSGKGYKFGLVLENSEYVSSSDEDETDKPEDRLQKGTVRVAWHPSGKETVVPENKVKLVDRSLMPGDVVRRLIPGQDTQCGFVMNMEVRAHLHILRSNKYLYNVDSKDLEPILKFESGQEVILDLWWGKVETVIVDTVLVFADGARCRVDEGDIVMYEDITEKQRHGEFSMCLHYPGQKLRGPMDALCDAKWLHSTPRYGHKAANKIGKSQIVYVTIEKIETRSVGVHWVFGGSNGPDGVSTPPPRSIEGEAVARLKILDWFSGCSLQIGDRMLYRIKNDDHLVTVDPGKAYDPSTAMIKGTGIQIVQGTGDTGHDKNNDDAGGPNNEQGAKDGDDEGDTDYEDVDEGEDSDDAEDEKSGSVGSRAAGGRGKKRNKGGFKPGSLRHKASKQNPRTACKRSGKERVVKPDMVVEVEAEFTTSWAKVMWQDGSIESDIPSVELFPVHHLDELEFFPGDFVLSNIDLVEPADYGVVASADHAERTCKVHWYQVYDAGKAAVNSVPKLVEANCEMSVYDLKDHPDYKFRPGQSVVPVGGVENRTEENSSACQTVGQIYELDPNGHLVVKWADGSISQRYPQEVFIVSDEADDDSDNDEWESESDYESNASSRESWETESEQEVVGEEEGAKADKDDSGCDQGALAEHKQELDSLLGRAESALVRLQKLLNTFDVSVSAPDCFHDIIRIYRNCHDLDKILKSSFFSDPELQLLISQAKQELKRDKTNKISKHLTQLFEAWSQSMPATGNTSRTFGLVGVDGKTITFGPMKNSASSLDVLVEMPATELSDGARKLDDSSEEAVGATGGKDIAVDREKNVCGDPSTSAENLMAAKNLESRVLKKEFSEPAIGSLDLHTEANGRRPSDPTVEGMSSVQHEAKRGEANLVGENCVAKASKRVKSDSFDESGREAKKSRDDTKYSNQVAQELCFKICKCLQKQILLIHEDMNKRTQRLFSSCESQAACEGKTESQAGGNAAKSSSTELCKQELTESAASCDKQPSNPVISPSVVMSEAEHKGGDSLAQDVTSTLEVETDSVPVSIDECGERVNETEAAVASGRKHGGDEKGDMAAAPAPSTDVDTGHEASCESPADQEDDDITSTFSDVKSEDVPCKGFQMDSEVPQSHAFVKKESQPPNLRSFRTAVKKELKLFQTSLPDGIFVHGFEDRLDLYSVMILGPDGTPYEDAVFLFDIMLPNDYPTSPPICHYHSYCSDRLNPNLYEDGKVCVSLLGTWSGKGTEVWTHKSNLLQVLLSIQGLILVREPYYNEAGFERQRGTQVGEENSRMYNEMAILKTCQSLTEMCKRPPETFKEEVLRYLLSHGPRMIARLQQWVEMSESKKVQPGRHQSGDDSISGPSSSAQAPPTTSVSAGEALPTTSVSAGEAPPPQDPLSVLSSPTPATATQAGSTVPVEGEMTGVAGGARSEVCSPTTAAASGSSQCVRASDSTGGERVSDSTGGERVAPPGGVGAPNSGKVPVADGLQSFTSSNEAAAEVTERGQSAGSESVAASSDTVASSAAGNNTAENVSSQKKKLSEGVDRTEEKKTVDSVHNKMVSVSDQLQNLSLSQNDPGEANGKQPRVDSNCEPVSADGKKDPEFPLFPMSRGFCITLRKHLRLYKKSLEQLSSSLVSNSS
ncbi:(E3-independent) E2 ubiquitin-conjugating enzyme UBE2O [Aplysia californica]|uniref:(E3-independent) E2 ubiquitin-conjugating enzyme UBE2O n=1 Tax=Aplysia californica TaxID=6500 RepID=A0ABM0K7A7_APLCA|nr:(E3-independent) E2 ubiquitin-conjugating enzyme UBE2O [Aplysia californica]